MYIWFLHWSFMEVFAFEAWSPTHPTVKSQELCISRRFKNIEIVHASFVPSVFRHVRISVQLLLKFAITISLFACTNAATEAPLFRSTWNFTKNLRRILYFRLDATILTAASQEELLAFLPTFSGTLRLTFVLIFCLFLYQSSFLSPFGLVHLTNFKTVTFLHFIVSHLATSLENGPSWLAASLSASHYI